MIVRQQKPRRSRRVCNSLAMRAAHKMTCGYEREQLEAFKTSSAHPAVVHGGDVLALIVSYVAEHIVQVPAEIGWTSCASSGNVGLHPVLGRLHSYAHTTAHCHLDSVEKMGLMQMPQKWRQTCMAAAGAQSACWFGIHQTCKPSTRLGVQR